MLKIAIITLFVISWVATPFASLGGFLQSAPANAAACNWTWEQVPSPNAPDATSARAISVVAADDIWAAGREIWHWNGSTWERVFARGKDIEFRDIQGLANGDAYALNNQLWHWNGDKWKPVGEPFPSSGNLELSALTVIQPTDIWVVGKNTGSNYGVALHWDGVVWQEHQVGNSTSLLNVTALASEDIWAVGDDIWHWNGNKWRRVATTDEHSSLQDVRALSPDDVWAAGVRTYFTGSHTSDSKGVLMHWDGSQWETLTETEQESSFLALAPLSETDVWAAGRYLWHWDGSTWTQLPSQMPNDEIAIHWDIAALSADQIWTVGTSNQIDAFALQHDNSQWNYQLLPTQTRGRNYLDDVAAFSSSDAWAVGLHQLSVSGNNYRLLMHWNGSEWALPSTERVVGELNAVAGSASNDVWAVGSVGASTPLVLHYDGSQWQEIDLSALNVQGKLRDVVALSNNNVWAVGSAEPQPYRTLILHWDGTQWERVASPNQSEFDNHLLSVAAVSASDIWAVGSTSLAAGAKPLSLRWNGQDWEPISALETKTNAGLSSVGSDPAGSVWTVGYATKRGALLGWDGNVWDRIESPFRSFKVVHAFAADKLRVIAGTDKSYDLISRWNGKQWTTEYDSKKKIYLTALSFSEQTGWAVGYSRNSRTRILRSGCTTN